MKRSIEGTPVARTWREIPQQVKPRAMSGKGRKRFVAAALKSTVVALMGAAVAWGALEIVATWRSDPHRIANAVNTAPVSEIVVLTDGVLDHPWVTRALALPRNATLMELDLTQLQQRLIATGQVRSAVVTKSFPSTLAVTLAERSPVARVMAQLPSGEHQELLVARDGVVFAGIGYDPAMTESLVWLSGITLVRQGDQFLPLGGMDKVAELLAKARNEAPHLYATWHEVDLSAMTVDAEIAVKSSEFHNVIFTTREDFYSQLAKLDSIRDQLAATAERPVAEVNLSVGKDVPVTLGDAYALPVPQAARRPSVQLTPNQWIAPSARAPAFPNLNRNRISNRDL